MAPLAKNEPKVGTASWAEAQGAESMAKTPSLSFTSATAGEKGGDTETENEQWKLLLQRHSMTQHRCLLGLSPVYHAEIHLQRSTEGKGDP